MMRVIALLMLGLLVGVLAFGCTLAFAGPGDAVVLIRSHGGSGTVIYTAPGKTYVLSAAHMFTGRKQSEPVKFEAPDPNPAAPKGGGARCIGVDTHADLALVEIACGPLPYVAPVAPAGHVAGRCQSVGYDELRWPAQRRPATLIAAGRSTGWIEYTPGWRWPWGRGGGKEPLGYPGHDDSRMQWTQELPWFGRSGGGLLDVDNGYLIGVCSGFNGATEKTWAEIKPGAKGRYASLEAVRTFVGRYAPQALGGNGAAGLQVYGAPAPWVEERREPVAPRPISYSYPQPMVPGRAPWVEERREPNPNYYRPACPPSL